VVTIRTTAHASAHFSDRNIESSREGARDGPSICEDLGLRKPRNG
jgi:hypothetical protein